MSLATRCVYCGASFKLVQDQLKVSQGWVKCGQCFRAFDALENLFDTQSNSEWSNSPTAPPNAPSLTTQTPSLESFNEELPPEPKTNFDDFEVTTPPDLSDLKVATKALKQSVFPPSKSKEKFQPRDAVKRAALATNKQPSRQRSSSTSKSKARQPSTAEFIKTAQRRAIWRHPLIRLLLGLLFLLLAAALALQMAHHWRNTLATKHPVLQTWLQQWCDVAQCTLSAPMDIQALRVDSIALVKTDDAQADAYHLTVTVQNTNNHSLQWPMLDLILTNLNGDVLIRRSLMVSDAKQLTVVDNTNPQTAPLTNVAPVVPPGLTGLQWHMRAPDLQLASYTAELYYP